MYRQTAAVTALLFSLLCAVWLGSAWQSAQLQDKLAQLEADRLMSQQEHHKDINRLEAEIGRLTEEKGELEQALLEREEEEPEFVPYDIPLDPDLQALAYDKSKENQVDFDLVLLVMYRESGWEWREPVMDRNGLYSVGYMMINEIAWEEMAAAGYDVHTPEGNIAAGIEILSRHQEKYGEERALVAYQCGEAKMLQNGWTHTPYSRWIMERAEMV